jgi:hypothetical protein
MVVAAIAREVDRLKKTGNVRHDRRFGKEKLLDLLTARQYLSL